MRGLVRTLLVAAALMPALPRLAPAQTAAPIPERRLVLIQDADLQGRDLRQIFDTTLEGCEAACLADSACTAFTFNTRNGSCFPKADITGESFFAGAYSGRVMTAAPGAAALARDRAADLTFLMTYEVDEARRQAAELANTHVTGAYSAEELLSFARDAMAAGDALGASQYQGAALNLTDASDQWVDYARSLLAVDDADTDRYAMAGRALSAAINGYLRAPGAPAQASALEVMAQALERVDRGAQMVPALRLANELAPRADLAAALDDARGKYGFRITDRIVENDLALPRVCAVFSEDLVAGGVDYATFVRLPSPGLSVEVSGAQLCVAGVRHGERVSLTFRAGLPAASGEALSRDVEVTQYVRDRSPLVRFPGRSYVLPRLEGAGIPVQTVNTEQVELVLQRVSDRNLVRAIREDNFARPLDQWSTEAFNDAMAQEVWRGSAKVAMQVNQDMTTRLPVQEVTGPLGPGVYVLQARVPGTENGDTAPASQWFVISDLGLTTWTGVDGLHVYVRGLGDAGPRAGLEVALVSRANTVLGRATTDADGYTNFDAALTAGTGGAAPALVQVEDGAGDLAFLSLEDPEFDLSDRGVEGRPAAPPVDVFLTPDRGAYRAGETIHATILARDAEARAISGLPLTAVLTRPDGVEYSRALAVEAGAGGYTLDLPVAGTAPRGTWTLEVYADPKAPALAGRRILVEDFLPERIDFALTLPEGPLSAMAQVPVDIAARYLFGAPGAGLGVEGEYRLTPARVLPGAEGYLFGRHDDATGPRYQSLVGTTTDAAGAASLRVVFSDEAQAATLPLEARFTLRVREGSGRPVEREATRVLMPRTPVIGIKPAFADGVVPEGTEAGFDLIALGPDAAQVDLPVTWVLNRIETDYQWYSLYGEWNWEETTRRIRVAEGQAALTAAGPARVSVPIEGGQYELVVSPSQSGAAASSVAFGAGWYAATAGSDTPDRLQVGLDRAAYAVGDTARLKVTARSAGVALVAVLTNRMVDHRVVPVAEGETVIDLPVTEGWGAGAYVTATVLRPLDQGAARAPARALGLAHAAVDPGDRRLTATIEAPAEADPRGPLPVAVKVAGLTPGQPAWVTVAAVDQGILNLTGFKSPDPQGHYFGQRKLGVAIRDLYGRLIDGQAGAPGEIRSGGDSGAGLRMKSPPPTEELVAYFSGAVQVGADGYARTEFDLPAFNGSVRLMAVAWSQAGVGQAEAEVLVRDPVVVTASVPRFLAPGDESRILLEIVHAAGPAGRMGLDVTAEGVTLGAVASGLDLAEQGKAVIEVPLRAGTAEGLGHVRIALTTPAGKQLVKDLTIPVQVNDPPVMVQSRFDLAAGDTLSIDENLFAGLVPGSARATLAAGPIARLDAPGLLAALDAYPYGCTEQVTARALPLLYFEEVAQALGGAGAGDVRPRVDQAIAAVLANQSASGAFGLWSPDSGDMWLDAFVTDFLSRARAQGYVVPDAAFRNALDNLRNQINYAPEFDTGGAPYAYALMVLAREGAAAIGDLRYYADVRAEAFDTPLAAAQLGAALALYGDQTRADRMFQQAAQLIARDRAGTEAQLWRADYGTRLRDAAAVLALAAEAGSTAIRPDDLTDAVATEMAGRRLSTQEATWALLATHALIDRPGTEGFAIDGTPVAGPLVKVLDDQTAGGRAVRITNGSGADSVVTLTTLGVPTDPVQAGGNGYAISRSYYDLDGAPVSPEAVAQGARLVVVLEIQPFGAGEARLIVDDPLPAGFEIDNPTLIRAGDVAALGWLSTVDQPRMTEFRQDRFLAAVDSTDGATFRLAYVVRAVSPGSFHHPAASVADMYRPDYRAQTDAGRATVTN